MARAAGSGRKPSPPKDQAATPPAGQVIPSNDQDIPLNAQDSQPDDQDIQLDKSEESGSKLKQAVVIVHGMGEQRPMETIRSFVETVWSGDTDLTPAQQKHKRKPDPETGASINKSWIKPNKLAGSDELRLITTPADINDRITEFYELYWSDVTHGTTVDRLWAWVKGLLFRRWSEVPRDVKGLYLLVWIAVLLIVGPGIFAAVTKAFGWPSLFCLSAGIWAAIAAAMTLLVSGILAPYLGDVAIYVQAFPGTVAKRKEARERGLALLQGLMDSPRYDRIVLVGHSLGTILAYDLLQLLWIRNCAGGFDDPDNRDDLDHLDDATRKQFEAVGKHALPMDSGKRAAIKWDKDQLGKFRELQWQTYQALRAAPVGKSRWKISDFVTLGSPLTHAEFLLTRNQKDFYKSIEERLFSTCPPVTEWVSKQTVLFPRNKPRHPHHAAMFAAMRWTNIYDRGNWVITGDPVSGPMTENFGPGVENIRVRLTWRFGRIFTHTTYWSRSASGREVGDAGPSWKLWRAERTAKSRSHIQVLRDAVDLRRSLEP